MTIRQEIGAINQTVSSCFNQTTFRQHIIKPDLSMCEFKKPFSADLQPAEEEHLLDAGNAPFLIQCKFIK